MKDHTTNPVNCKTLRDLLVRGLGAIGSKIFGADDREARDLGWQIIPIHGGLGRSYRDPRFNYLIACTACNGRGSASSGERCSDCRRTGRVTLKTTDSSQRG